MLTNIEKIKLLALDLTKAFPRSPNDTLSGYIIVCRTLDKCRAFLNGSAGEYHFDCSLDRRFFDFTEINSTEFKDFVSTGATDLEVSEWITQKAKKRERIEIISWNNSLRYIHINELPVGTQEYLEDYIPKFIPKNRRVHHFFDVYDIEEGRM